MADCSSPGILMVRLSGVQPQPVSQRHGCTQIARTVGRSKLRWRLGLDADSVVYCSADPLFTAQIAFGRLDRNVSEKKLNLVQFPARRVTQLRTRAAEVVGRESGNPNFPCVFLNDMPDDALGHAGTPAFACSTNATK